VTGPASLVGVDAGSLVGPDGNGLLGRDAGALVGVDAGTLRGPVWSLLQAEGVPLARTVVLLAGPDGTPVNPRVQAVTDASGRYTLQARGRGGVVVALARTTERRLVRLSGLLHEGASGQVAISPATTLVTTALMAEVKGTGRNFSAVRAADYRTAVDGVASSAERLGPAALSSSDALLAAAREALSSSEVAAAGFGRAVGRLTTAEYDSEPPSSAPGPATAASAEPGETSALSEAASRLPAGDPGAPSPQTSPTPVLGAQPSPSSEAPQASWSSPAPASAPPPTAPTPSAQATAGTGLVPLVTPAPTPTPFMVDAKPPAGNCAAPTYANVTLAAGDSVTLSATGIVTLRAASTATSFGPAGGGSLDATRNGCDALAPDLPRGALIVRFGTGNWQLVGPGPKTFSRKTGRLFLAVNDHYALNNSGAFAVTITVKRASP
jgi:hypothetical protein